MNESKLPEIVLGVVLNKNSKVLIVQRARVEKGTNGKKLSWAFPGGRIEKNETKEEALKREIDEETGYQVMVDKIISERQHPQFPVYVYYLKCDLISSKNSKTILDPDIKSVSWVNKNRLKVCFTSELDPKVAEYLNL